MTKPFYISKEGLDKLKKELNYLKTIKRREIAQRIQEAKEMGDLSENTEYSQARDDQSFNENRITELEERIKNAKIIIRPVKKQAVVAIGSSIVVSTNGTKKEFTIVGSEEANPAEGKISNESPLGEKFLGKSIGDKVEIITPKGKAVYKILGIK